MSLIDTIESFIPGVLQGAASSAGSAVHDAENAVATSDPFGINAATQSVRTGVTTLTENATQATQTFAQTAAAAQSTLQATQQAAEKSQASLQETLKQANATIQQIGQTAKDTSTGEKVVLGLAAVAVLAYVLKSRSDH